MSRRSSAARVKAGSFWLQWRKDRRVWEIAWYDPGGFGRKRRVRRIATSCTDRGSGNGPPEEAVRALYDHHAASSRRTSEPADEYVETLLADWLDEVELTNADPARAANAVARILQFFERERAAGRVDGGPRVSHIDRRFCRRYAEWRLKQPGLRGRLISGATVDRELAALRAALKMAEDDKRIARAPKVFSVPENQKSAPRDVVYSALDIAKILEAAARLPERRHVVHYVIITLSTHCRGEALLELDLDDQVSNGVIDFLRPGETQTKKKRSKVRMAPTLERWIERLTGKAIEARSVRFYQGEGTLISKPCSSIKTAFTACLLEAGLAEPVLDLDGKQVIKLTKTAAGRIKSEPQVRVRGSPNALRHTIATFLHVMGIPEAQIDMAAGHDGTSTNAKNYRHMRPEYLTDFCRGIEAFWVEVDKHTKVHRLPHCYPKLTVEEALKSRAK